MGKKIKFKRSEQRIDDFTYYLVKSVARFKRKYPHCPITDLEIARAAGEFTWICDRVYDEHMV